jgi:predicted ferric reductase
MGVPPVLETAGTARQRLAEWKIMRNILIAPLGALALLTGLWLAAEPGFLQAGSFLAVRALMMQYSGIVAIACMSVAMMLALRPRWPETWFGGLDKMYRLHKWLGITALAVAVFHWLWANGPKWATALGWYERPQRGPRPAPDGMVEQTLMQLRGPAESVGEWVFYGVVILIVLALVKQFPYRRFFKTHRILAAAYLALVFHAVVLTKLGYWTSPIGMVMLPLLAGGSWAAVVVLVRQVGAGRRVPGTITAIHAYSGVRSLEVEVAMPHGWPGHTAGQFAFVTVSAAEGAHPYTIASAWNDATRRLTFVIKELGDHTRDLRDTLRVGQSVVIEGPYGRFTFEDTQPNQVWVGAGIGITPFIARMKHLAAHPACPPQIIDLFHTTTDHDEQALVRLRADAAAAGVRLHILIGHRDGRLTGERIRTAVPRWREASTWFCGPALFGKTLRKDFGGLGVPVRQRFHQEVFAMR